MEASHLQFSKYTPELNFTKPQIAYKTGGVHMNYDKDEQLKAIFLDVTKQVSTKFMKGQIANLETISKPIVMCHPITAIETVSLQFQSFPKYLSAAARTKDPVERMKLVIAGIISSINISLLKVKSKLPLDPQIGETLQQIGEDGTKFYAEALCKNPAVLAYYVIGPDDCYKLHGSAKLEGEFIGVNTIRCYKRGKTVVRFADGEEIQITNPIMEVHGAVQGDRVANYIQQMVFADKKNSLLCEITFEKQAQQQSGGYLGKFKGIFGGKSSNEDQYTKTTDNFSLEIMNYQKNAKNQIINRKELCKGSGSWLSYLEIDGLLYWRFEDKFEEWKTLDELLLPSDASRRLDKQNMLSNNLQEAQKYKIEIDNQDIEDANLRKKFKK